MKIVIDLQASQGFARDRGMGRYSLAMAQEMARLGRGHEIWIALNGLFPETIDPLRAAFEGLIPQERIVTWISTRPISEFHPGTRWRREAAERIREAFLASLRPDAVLVSNHFEGPVSDTVTSMGTLEKPGYLTGVIFYDLIPLIHPGLYLPDPVSEAWYLRKLAGLCRADLFLAISESSRREGIDLLSIPEDRIVNISGAADPEVFRRVVLAPAETAALLERHRIQRPFVMYTGNHDARKNTKGLVEAYGRLPKATRAAHQLAIVCSLNELAQRQLWDYVRDNGLTPDDVVYTGYVSESDLVALYSLCATFAFSSWHEGFGLPALEAMSCGAAVVAANTTSLPEVIGRDDALFDPHDPADIAAKLDQVLNDPVFRKELQEHGLRQAQKFSWKRTALRALEAFEALHARTLAQAPAEGTAFSGLPVPRPKLACVSPLAPRKGEAASFVSELLPQLSVHYDIEVISDQPEVGDAWIRANCALRSPAWFDRNAARYDRVLYNFGEDPETHGAMLGLLAKHPGTVVLHEFFLGGSLQQLDKGGRMPGAWTAALYASHGYPALLERAAGGDAEAARAFPANLPVLHAADGIITTSSFCRSLAESYYGPGVVQDWEVVPAPRTPIASGEGRKAARTALSLKDEDFLVCAFGPVAPGKLSHRLLKAWLGSSLAADPRCHLMFCGDIADPAYRASLIDPVASNPAMKRVYFVGNSAPELYRRSLAAADVAVQLQAASGRDDSGAVLDCLNSGLPTVVNAQGALAGLPQDAVAGLGDAFGDGELAAALETLRRDPDLRSRLGRAGLAYIRTTHDSRKVAGQYRELLERFAATGRRASLARLRRSIGALSAPPGDPGEWAVAAQAIAANHPSPRRQRQLLINISELARHDYKTGIQRVVRSLLDGFLRQPPAGYRVEPIYLADDGTYRYARRYTMRFLGQPETSLNDEVIEITPGDFFLGLDFCITNLPHLADLCLRLKRQGAWVCFVVYDLLPLRGGGWSLPQTAELFLNWVRLFSQVADGVLCISKGVAHEMAQWLNQNRPQRRQALQIDWFHLGADVAASRRDEGVPDGFDEALAPLRVRPTVLMVGTVEPRKGYVQTVAAFELLWQKGVDANLVIVGKRGWLLDEFWARLERHPEMNRRLFWLQNATDAMLLKLYGVASGLLFASEAEGFGLPLVEAARHRIPVLTRDVPVLREVAGAHAAYFTGTSPDSLATALEAWLEALRSGTAPKSDAMPVLSWGESYAQVVDALFGSRRHLFWRPDKK